MNGMPRVNCMQCRSLSGGLDGSWGIAPQGGHERHSRCEGMRRVNCLRGHAPGPGLSSAGGAP